MSKQGPPPGQPKTFDDSTQGARRGRGLAFDAKPIAKDAGIRGVGAPTSGGGDALLQARLRAVGTFFSVALTLTLIRDILYAASAAWQLQVAAILGIATCTVLLTAPRTFNTRWLRANEAALFGATALVLAIRVYNAMLVAALRDDPVAIVSASKNMIIMAMILMFSHALFIPGNWRRASRFALAFAALPGATTALLLLTHPKLMGVLGHVATTERIARDLTLLLVSGGLSIYGTHVLGVLRKEAFEAKRLNQYQLRDKIGSGGMGEVYLAEHQLLKRPCAIKLIRPDRAGEASALARFEKEVRATARLTHPNIVDIYDYGATADGTFYYVMEYLQGMTLEELSDLYGPQPAGRVIYLLRQACEALAEAHGAGLIHRDIKPANLFAARRGGRYDFIKLLDFGLVKEQDVDSGTMTLRQTHTPPGTPQFMAPEQINGERPVDHRIDLYAIGGVAYLLLTGRAAFEGESAAAVMIAATRDPVVPPSKIRSDVPEDLERIVLRCLAKEPDGRFADALELERALASCRSAGDWDHTSASHWWHEAGRPLGAAATV